LFKKHEHLHLEVYTDTNLTGGATDRISNFGYCIYVGGNLVTWQIKKQSVVARSSVKAKFRAIAHRICKIIWIKRFLEDLKILNSSHSKNKVAISIAHNSVFHDRTKHVEVNKHFIKKKIGSGMICMSYVPTTKQVVDILTKGLHKKQFDNLISKLTMEDIFKST
jgi:hypothetical protein